MIEKKVISIEITPCFVIETSNGKTRLGTFYGKDSNEFESIYSISLVDIKEGDYFLRGRMIGEGFIQINYVKMDDKDIKKYFPKLKEKQIDIFSDLAKTSFFSQER